MEKWLTYYDQEQTITLDETRYWIPSDDVLVVCSTRSAVYDKDHRVIEFDARTPEYKGRDPKIRTWPTKYLAATLLQEPSSEATH